MSNQHDTCAACRKPLGVAYLLCGEHWNCVPRGLQAELFGARGRWQRTPKASPLYASLQRDYAAVRERVVATARGNAAQPAATPPTKGAKA